MVLSESLAFQACADLANRILDERGINDRYTGEQLLTEFVGQNFRGMICKLAEKYALELSPDELKSFVMAEEDEVISKLKAALEPCQGVSEVLEKLHNESNYKLAVVSSSALRRLHVSLSRVGFDRYFEKEAIFSAATSLPQPTSKPDPAVYCWAMEKLGVSPSECLAIEDSRSGALSARRAGIKTIGYIGSYQSDEVEKIIPILEDSGVAVIMKHWSEFGNILDKVQKGTL